VRAFWLQDAQKKIFGKKYNASWEGDVNELYDSTNAIKFFNASSDSSENILLSWVERPVNSKVALLRTMFFRDNTWQNEGIVRSVLGEIKSPRVFMNDRESTILWIQVDKDATKREIWSASSIGGGWSDPVLVSNGDDDAFHPLIKSDRDGNIFALWVQKVVGQSAFLHMSKRSKGQGWGDVQVLPKTGDGKAFTPNLAFGPQGAVVIWPQPSESGKIDIWTTSSVNGEWSIPENIDKSSKHCRKPKISIDREGNVIAVWFESPTTMTSTATTNIGVNRRVGGKWGEAFLLEKGNGIADFPSVVFDQNQNAMVQWRQQTPAAIEARYFKFK